MPAYWVARSKINDPVAYKKYTDLVPAIIARHGGKVLSRGAPIPGHGGPEEVRALRHRRVPFARRLAWPASSSTDYQDAAAFRRANGAGEVETVMLEAGEFTRALRQSRQRACRLAHSRCCIRRADQWPAFAAIE